MTPGGRTPVQAAREAARRGRLRQPTAWLRLGILAAFALVPLVAPSFKVTDLALKIALFATLAASYDVVIGYTGIVSFGHAMYFGIGAYAVALALGKLGGVTYGHLGLGFLAGISWMLYVLSRENQLTLATLSDGRRAVFYGAFGMIALMIAGATKLLSSGGGTLVWILLLGASGAAIVRIWIEANTHSY